MTGKIYDFLAYRKKVDLPPALRTMTPEQCAQRKFMEEGDWIFLKINALQEVVMQFGDPVTMMAFIQDSGFTEQYQINGGGK